MRVSLAALAALLVPLPALAIDFSFPLACTAGVDCVVQHYVDRDAGPDALDYHCGHQTYDGHKGTDIRIPDLARMKAGVAVLAAADGMVRGIRDGMPDAFYDEANAQAVKDRECGNGVLLDHGDGWVSQYCHMKEGSVLVKPGDRVAAGTPLGEVGLSGETQFPHLHFEVRRDDATVDPFAVKPAADGTCSSAGDAATSIWNGTAKAALAYRAAFVLNAGFATGSITMDEIESGSLAGLPVDAQSPALVFYGRAIGIEKGDRQRLTLTGPGGDTLAETEVDPADRVKAQVMAFVGKKRHDQPWPAGVYRGRYAIIRDGAEIAVGEATLEISP